MDTEDGCPRSHTTAVAVPEPGEEVPTSTSTTIPQASGQPNSPPASDRLTTLQQELELEKRKNQVLRNQVVQRNQSDRYFAPCLLLTGSDWRSQVEKLQHQLAFKEQELRESQDKATLLAESQSESTSTFISNLQVFLFACPFRLAFSCNSTREQLSHQKKKAQSDEQWEVIPIQDLRRGKKQILRQSLTTRPTF